MRNTTATTTDTTGVPFSPIHSISGKVVAFGGRQLKEDESAKYQNSPESIVYQKGTTFMASTLPRNPFRRKRNATSWKVTAMWCRWCRLASRILWPRGTALTEDQIRLLKRIIPSVVRTTMRKKRNHDVRWRCRGHSCCAEEWTAATGTRTECACGGFAS